MSLCCTSTSALSPISVYFSYMTGILNFISFFLFVLSTIIRNLTDMSRCRLLFVGPGRVFSMSNNLLSLNRFTAKQTLGTKSKYSPVNVCFFFLLIFLRLVWWETAICWQKVLQMQSWSTTVQRWVLSRSQACGSCRGQGVGFAL